MAAASPASTQLPPGREMPIGFARGGRDDGGCVAVGVGLAAADPVPVGAGTGATTLSSGWVGAAVGGAVVAGADGGGPGGVDGPVDGGAGCWGGSGRAGGGVGRLPAAGVASAGRTRTQPGSMWSAVGWGGAGWGVVSVVTAACAAAGGLTAATLGPTATVPSMAADRPCSGPGSRRSGSRRHNRAMRA